MMVKIDYPNYTPSIKTDNNKEYIFDAIRKQWILLTPEEWVRQNFLQYLIHVKKYPSSLIAVEKEIIVNGLKKRFDIVVYDININPWMLIECKEMEVPLNEKVINQALQYNSVLQAVYAVITNGTSCYVFKLEKGKLYPQATLPSF
jgi:hypothetical protein